MKNIRTLYVVADGGRGRFVRKQEGHAMFETLWEVESSDIHKHARDVGADRPGRTHESANSASHAVQPREDIHAATKRSFAHEIAQAVNEAYARGEFDRLVLVAPAHTLIDLRGALDAATRSLVAAELQKDLTNVPNADLMAHLADLTLV